MTSTRAGPPGARWVLWMNVALWLGCGPNMAEAPEAQAPLATLEQRHTREGSTRWVRRSVGSLDGDVFAPRVTTDRDGANILFGQYEGAPDFGNGPLPAAAAFTTNALIVKYARDGRLLWAHGYGPAEPFFTETYFGVATTDHQRNITVSGYSEGSMELGGVTVRGFFLAQFSGEGEVRWVRPLWGSYGGFRLAVDRQDNVILVGGVDGPADFGGGQRTTGPISAFLVKYTRDGAWLWDRVFVAEDTSEFLGVDLDEEDHLYVAGSFNEETDFGGGPMHPSTPGEETAVVARYTASGEHVWSRTLEGATELTRFDDVAVHGNRVVVVGRFTGRFDFGGRAFTAPAVGSSGLVLAVTRDGEERWGHVLGGWIHHVHADHADDVTVLGHAFPGQDVGAGPLPSTAFLYAFVSKLDRVDGERDWVRTFSAQTTGFAGLSVSREGEVAVAGSFRAPVDFGTGTLQPTTLGVYDAFLLRMSP